MFVNARPAPQEGTKILDEMMKLVSEMSSDDNCLSLDEFLLPDDHPIVMHELKRLTELRATAKGNAPKQDVEWPKQHAALREQLGLPYSRSVVDESVRSSPWYGVMNDREEDRQRGVPKRECSKARAFQSECSKASVPKRARVFQRVGPSLWQDLLGVLMASNPDDCVFEVSQGAARAKSTSADAVNTIIPATMFWHKTRKRFILGYELARLQLIPVDEVDKMFSHKLMADLAGNAFNGGSFLCVLIAVLTCLPPYAAHAENDADASMLAANMAMLEGL